MILIELPCWGVGVKSFLLLDCVLVRVSAEKPFGVLFVEEECYLLVVSFSIFS